MAFNSILRKSGSFARALAVAGQLTKNSNLGHRSLHFTAINQHQHKDSFVPRFHFSSVASKKKPTSDENLLRLIESEIECAQETDDHNAVSSIFSLFNSYNDDCLFFILIEQVFYLLKIELVDRLKRFRVIFRLR